MTQQLLNISFLDCVLIDGYAGFIDFHPPVTRLESDSKVKCFDNFSTNSSHHTSVSFKEYQYLLVKKDVESLQQSRCTTQNADDTSHQGILASRGINNAMEQYMASDIIERTNKNYFFINDVKTVNLGISQKDIYCEARNNKSVKVINQLKKNTPRVSICDPLTNALEVLNECDPTTTEIQDKVTDNAIALSVGYNEFLYLNFKTL